MLVLTVVLLLLVGAALVLRHDLSGEYEQRALAIARSVAQEPGLADAVTDGRPTTRGPVQQAAERVRTATGALYVVVTDTRGIRYSHPTLGNIGAKVSTSPDAALAGHDVATIERGTLGPSARGKVPLRDHSGRIVGEVSVGISMRTVTARTWQLALVLGLVALGALAVGIVGAVTQGRRLRRTTLGLEPEEMADLVREHAAVLGGVRDGIIAVDANQRVTVVNPEAERLVGASPVRGTPLAAAGLPDVVTELLTTDPAPAGITWVLGDRVVVVHRIAVQRDGRDLGQVLTLRDRTDLDEAARELEATRALTDALRAQSHEHRNRLHALGGLLHLGHVEQAEHYLDELSADLTSAGLGDPYLSGLVAAKAALASEAGVRLEVGRSSYVDGTLTAPLDVVTVLGNLIDNAIRAAAAGPLCPGHVEVNVVSDGRDLVMHVVDSGPGVPPDDLDSIFRQGFTTRGERAAADHGIGLSVARLTARSHHGDVALADAGGAGQGATFTARMRDVLAPTHLDTRLETPR